jgi:hypothetical protein
VLPTSFVIYVELGFAQRDLIVNDSEMRAPDDKWVDDEDGSFGQPMPPERKACS